MRFAALTVKGANMNPQTQSHSKRHYLVGVLLALTGTLFFSAKSIVIKKVYQYGVGVESLMVLRMAMAAPIYALIFLLNATRGNAISAKDLLAICAIGVIGYYMASYLDLSGLRYISASFERIILYLFPSFVLIISVVFFNHKLKTSEVLAFVLSYLGIMVIYAQDFQAGGHEVTRGMLLVLGSALAFSLFVVLSGQYIAKAGSVRFTSISMLGASVAVFLHYLAHGAETITAFDRQSYAWILVLALLCTVLPSYLINMAVQRIGAPRVAILGTISPVFTIVMAYAFLHELSTVMHIVGFALVIMGIAVISVPKPKPAPGKAVD